MTTGRDPKTGRMLPGFSANPNPSGGGKQKGLERIVREATDFPAIIAHLGKIALGIMPAGNYGEITVKVRDSIEAAKVLFDRGYGKARIVVDLTTGGEGALSAVNVDELDDDAAEALEQAVDRALHGRAIDVEAREVAAVKRSIRDLIEEQGKRDRQGGDDARHADQRDATVTLPQDDALAPGHSAAEPAREPVLERSDGGVDSPEVTHGVVATPAMPVAPAMPRRVVRHVFVGSDNVALAELDLDSGVVLVQFTSGARYRYANFSTALLDQWKTAVSAGKWFAANVRTNADHPVVVVPL